MRTEGTRIFARGDDGRNAERYVDLLKLQDARADSDMRLSMLASIVNEWCRMHPNGLRDIDGLTKMITALLKIEQTRISLNGWAAPARVAHRGRPPRTGHSEVIPAPVGELPQAMKVSYSITRLAPSSASNAS